jgi:hypothetical protein
MVLVVLFLVHFLTHNFFEHIDQQSLDWTLDNDPLFFQRAGFQRKLKIGVMFFELTDACDTVW